MKRRNFLATTALSLPVILSSCKWIQPTNRFDINVASDYARGHSLMKARTSWKSGPRQTVETLIVGGGIAGLTAAYQLRNTNCKIVELSSSWGGTSGAISMNEMTVCTGAHYDLAYPENYGEEILKLLEELGIIYFQPWMRSWAFKEKQYVIPNRRKSRCYDFGEYRGDVLPEGSAKTKFEELLATFSDKMPMPSRLIADSERPLDKINFKDYLLENVGPDEHFIRCMDYHMRDDYGAPTHMVSALAGIHYFICRPYYTQVVELFSPPSGNYYFIDKLLSSVAQEKRSLSQMVMSINEVGAGFEVELANFQNQSISVINAEKVIYAGNKHALKHIFPSAFPLFEDNKYAPWLVVNIQIRNEIAGFGYWQNEMLVEDPTFLGFVDSNMQYKERKPSRIFTCYYCLPPESRNDLVNLEDTKAIIADTTIAYVSKYLGKEIRELVISVNMKAMGHAMPIPGTNYLFNDANERSNNEGIIFAGVDNSRLPLFFEAADSGMLAAERAL